MDPTSSLDLLSRAPASALGRPARRVPAWLWPAGMVAGFGLLFLLLYGDRLLPAPAVRVGRVLATPAASGEVAEATPGQNQGPVLFQASGWIEPLPLPVKATALVEGVVDGVHVLHGEPVKKGQVLATMVDADAKLALAMAGEVHRTRLSELEEHRAAIEAARKKVAGMVARASAAEALEDEAADRLARVERLPGGAMSQSDVVSARLRLARETSQQLAAVSETGQAEAEVARLVAGLVVREAEVRQAAVAVDTARLALERTRITSPIDGRVLKLMAAPGQKKMLTGDDPDSSTIATLYDPARLQVRVDVPLADAGALAIGQPALVRCALLPDRPFKGEVLLISGEADVQRNTLQAKVRIDAPADGLRPEMLCRVEFFAPVVNPDGSSPTASAPGLSTWCPREALKDAGVWVVDPESRRVRERAVTTTADERDGHVRIAEGLRPGEWVVLSPAGLSLRDGKRVQPQTMTP